MKKLFTILLLSSMLPVYADVIKVPTPPRAAASTSAKSSGLYDDILQDKYAGCKSIECIEKTHRENMALLDAQERQTMYLMHEAQMQNLQATPQQIHYGYNAKGNYVPTSIGGQKIHYGYNPYGEFVPTFIGN